MENQKKSLAQLNLTTLESMIMNAYIPMLYAEAGFSDVDVNDLSKALNISSKIIRGALGSLVKKDILSIDSNEEYDLIYLREQFWYLHSQEWAEESRF